MRKLILSAFGLLAAFIVFGTIGGINTAEAKVVCSGNACTAAGRAAVAPAIRGPKAPTTSPMACIRAVSYGPTEIIWVAGNERNYVNAPVIETQRKASGYTRTFELNGGWKVVESCIPTSKLRNVRELTICNGSRPGEGYHWELASHEIRSLRRGGHASSYVPLLAEGDILSLPKARVKAAYRSKYR